VSLWLDTSIVGQPDSLEFRKDRDHTFCAICGKVFQPALNRLPDEYYGDSAIYEASVQRRAWAIKHAKTHPEREHLELRASGRMLTPEAIQKLTAYGIIPLSDIVFSGEHEESGRTAPRMPEENETTLKGGIYLGR